MNPLDSIAEDIADALKAATGKNSSVGRSFELGRLLGIQNCLFAFLHADPLGDNAKLHEVYMAASEAINQVLSHNLSEEGSGYR